MVKSVARKDEGSEKDAKIQSQIKEIAALKAEAKKGSELESKLRTAEAALSESNKVRDGLRSRCKELEEELKQAKKAAGGERIIGDSHAIPESAGTIHSENEGEGDSAYNPHKKVLDSIFGYAEQVHETKEKLRFLNYVTYIAETKLEEMYSAAFDY
jgi:DNA repair exonuclease SbcCD ATPase subunit